MNEYRLGFIGFGHMAQILFQAIEAARIIPRSQIQFIQRDPAKMKRNEQKYKITSTSMERLISTSDILILGVRPPQAEAAVAEMARCGCSGKKILSILAGVPIRFFHKYLGESAQVMRLMPNIASAIGEGMTILSFAPNASPDFRTAAQLLAAPLGHSLELPESQMDAATGIAGSGPGFVFRLIRAMAAAGERDGLAPEKALSMAAQAFIGAARLISKGEDPASLISSIATPGGTTEAGYEVMDSTELLKHFQTTVEASIQKSKKFHEEYR